MVMEMIYNVVWAFTHLFIITKLAHHFFCVFVFVGEGGVGGWVGVGLLRNTIPTKISAFSRLKK